MPPWLEALFWGSFAGAALLLGAGIAWKLRVPPNVVGLVMAFGAGVLISALAFELVADAQEAGGLVPTAAGFLAGAGAFVGANVLIARSGARHRKRSGTQQAEESGSGLAIALGALLDGVPESIVLGLSVVSGGAVSPAIVAAIFISNVPEGLSSTSGMRNAGRPGRYVFGVWGGIALASGLAALFGFLALDGAPAEVVAFITAIAAGGILAMVADTMIPEAFEREHLLTGLVASLGFLTSFVISQAG
ncbi:ZIP family zinc transporter [Sinomonas halotolerans]|uniref:ZIP family zinc transporter n=1 Tax=Sinomonas halotolerans TaxID=1644133 RepID=A0ABU9X3F6_9MICC